MEIAILFKAEEIFSYAYHLGNKPFIPNITIINKGEEATQPMRLMLTSNPSFFADVVVEEIPVINPQESYTITNINLVYDTGMLSNITEEVKSTISCFLHVGDECVAEKTQEIKVMPYDEVSNWEKDFKLLVGYVTPNQADVQKIVTAAANKKGEKFGEYSILAYAADREEVIRTIRCSYEAIQDEEIIYVYLKQGFHGGWQRIRLADEILKEKQGNCLDLTLLFASIFEAEGLNPFIMRTKGHAFVGVWTKGMHMPEAVYSDKEDIVKILEENKQDMVLLECTLARKGANTGYEYAVSAAEKNASKSDELVALIDVKAARKEGIHPIPSRISDLEENGEEIPFSYPEIEETEEELEQDNEEELEEIPPVQVPDKLTRWKNKLLDVTAGSDLLNIKITAEGKRAAQLPDVDIYQLYQQIKSGKTFTITGEGKNPEEIKADLEARILHTNYTAEATKKLLATLRSKDSDYRDQKGASIMYLTLGCVHWYEKKNEKWYHSPILMVPMTFIKEAKQLKLYYDGAEIHVNAAVLEMLNGRFGIQVPGLSEEPLGNDGLPDMKMIIKKLTAAFKDQKDLEVVECAHIGIFAFAQYMMWNDLDKNQEFYLNHPLVGSIKEGQKAKEIDENLYDFDEKDVFLPISADGAQIKAMMAALGNQSFVLHGPPGTGKSQTITAMLANFIGHDRSVLFAAEKAAALQVVYNRMRMIGLAPFCLYLPVDSVSRTTMERFLTQYKDLMEMAETEPTKYDEVSKQIEDEKSRLSKQLAIFDDVKYSGYTLKELVGNVLNSKEHLIAVDKISEHIKERVREGKLKELADLLKDTMHMGETAGGAQNHPLSKWGDVEYKFGVQKDARYLLRQYQELLATVATYHAKLEGLEWEDSVENTYTTNWEKCQAAIDVLKVPESVRGMENLPEKLTVWLGWSDIQEQREELYKELDPGVTKLNLERMANKWKLLMKAKTYESSYEKLVMKNELSKYLRREKPSERYITEMFDKALKLKKLNEDYPKELGFSLPLNKQQTIELRKHLDKYFANGIPKALKKVSEDQKQLLEKLLEALKEKADHEKKMKDFFGNDLFNWEEGTTVSQMLKDIRKQIQGLDTFREWNDYQDLKAYCLEEGLEPWIILYENGANPDVVRADFLAGSTESMLGEICETSEMVKDFAGFRFENLVDKFTELMDSFYAICAEEIKHRHLVRIQKAIADPENEKDKVALKKIIEANGKGITIREIMNTVGGFILKLTPCVMATPMTTSMYFPLQAVTFEHMILDEASQLQTCKSVGLIARSKHSIIVGDPNQMPPTSFFEGASAEYNLSILEEDQESILKDCIALDLPDYYLKWHYRSHHESLIAFSNTNYYGGKMITFPAADKKSKVHVIRTNGIYDRGNTITNPIEAETLVTNLEEMILDGDMRSFGIIAFNKRQQTLIEQLIEERAEENPSFAQGLEQMQEIGEPLFVRNLESVQGDERDVILFSIGYGPDKDGKLVMAFGPLAKAGGWRRLNVAITRARDEMILFTSMDAKQMELSETASKGVKDLKNFISYAEGNEMSVVENAEGKAGSNGDGFVEAVCKFLAESGYEYETNVGNSALKVDIAVYDQEKENFILGIMLNNKNTNSDFTIYDSEIGQNRILKKQGWNLLRIWSLDWYEDSEREMNRILNKIKKDSVEE